MPHILTIRLDAARSYIHAKGAARFIMPAALIVANKITGT
jgi:hypothetical protein